MKLNLTKPLIVFDLETTGLDMVKTESSRSPISRCIQMEQRYVKPVYQSREANP